MSKKNQTGIDIRNIDNCHNGIFSVSKLKLIKKIYKKSNYSQNFNLDDFHFEDHNRDRYKQNIDNNLKKNNDIETFEKKLFQKKTLKNKINRKESQDKINIEENISKKKNEMNYDFLINDSKLKNLNLLISGNFNSNKSSLKNNTLQFMNESKKKTEFNSNDKKIEQENSFEARLYDEKKVKRLEEWDKHKLIVSKKKKNILSNKDLESLNRMNEIRDSLSRIDKKNMTTLLNEFYKKNETEQGTILMSNINLGKKTFNFEVFDDKKNKVLNDNFSLNSNSNFASENYSDRLENNKDFSFTFYDNNILSKENLNKVRPKTQSFLNNYDKNSNSQKTVLKSKFQSKSDINFDNIKTKDKHLNDFLSTKKLIEEFNKKKEDDFFRSNDIKIEGELENLVNKDLYRKVIKEKQELENSYRKELMNVAQLIYKKKMQKEKFNKECILFANNLQNIRNEFREKKDLVETHKKELDKILGTKLNYMNLNNSIESSQISKDSSFRFRKEERVQQIKDYQKLIQQKDSELNNLSKEYEMAKIKYLNSIQEKKVYMKGIEDELKDLKINMSKILEDQRKYFIEILKKGIDSRREGLNWVVKRLIELNTQMDYSIFPRFLDHSQIDYLLKISYRQIECLQLKLIFKSLKKSQKKINKKKDSLIDCVNNTCKNFFSPNTRKNQMKFNSNAKNKIKGQYFFNLSFSEKLISVFDTIIKNNMRLTKNSDHSKLDDVEVVMIFLKFVKI